MKEHSVKPGRRLFLKSVLGMGTLLAWPNLLAAPQTRISNIIPSSKERIPAIGMGSWLTFDIGDDTEALATRVKVLERFFQHGGGMIDSSPMYGSSEHVIGQCLKRLQNSKGLFSATKVWTWGKQRGIEQMENSRQLWGLQNLDLMQIHNMLDWQDHLQTLKQMKADGKIRYIGITTSHGRRHDDLEAALESETFDFVQFTYNVLDRAVEDRLLPLAQERGIATIINRPFRGGDLFVLFRNKPLPAWAAEIGIQNWAQFFLKFIISHPAVTCAIPATSQVTHMEENMGAGTGTLPNAKMRQKMLKYIKNI